MTAALTPGNWLPSPQVKPNRKQKHVCPLPNTFGYEVGREWWCSCLKVWRLAAHASPRLMGVRGATVGADGSHWFLVKRKLRDARTWTGDEVS